MDTWAVIKTGGKQYKVSPGQTISVEKLNAADNSQIAFDVLAVKGTKGLEIGTPLITKAKVKAKVVAQVKDKKVRVVKFKPKSRYLRTTGHRQPKTQILIEEIQ